MIVPFSNDQFAWAHRARDLGVGARPIYKKKLTAEALAGGIAQALQDGVVNNARALGQKIQREHGAREAAGVLAALTD